MKPKIMRIIPAAIAVIFMLSSTLYAQHPYSGKDGAEGKDRGKKFDSIMSELQVTPEQQAKLKQQREEFKSKDKELMEKMRAKKEELRKELEKPEIDKAKTDSIINDIKNLTGEKLKNRVDKITAMKSVLTQEQFEKLQKKMHEKKKDYTGKHEGKRGFKCR